MTQKGTKQVQRPQAAPWTKAKAMAIARRVSVDAAARETGYSRRTVFKWLNQLENDTEFAREIRPFLEEALTWEDAYAIKLRQQCDDTVELSQDVVTFIKKVMQTISSDPSIDNGRIKALALLMDKIVKAENVLSNGSQSRLEKHREIEMVRTRLRIGTEELLTEAQREQEAELETLLSTHTELFGEGEVSV